MRAIALFNSISIILLAVAVQPMWMPYNNDAYAVYAMNRGSPHLVPYFSSSFEYYPGLLQSAVRFSSIKNNFGQHMWPGRRKLMLRNQNRCVIAQKNPEGRMAVMAATLFYLLSRLFHEMRLQVETSRTIMPPLMTLKIKALQDKWELKNQTGIS